MGRATLVRAPIQELYDPTLESVAKLDDLQRSWETLKNVVCDALDQKVDRVNCGFRHFLCAFHQLYFLTSL